MGDGAPRRRLLAAVLAGTLLPGCVATGALVVLFALGLIERSPSVGILVVALGLGVALASLGALDRSLLRAVRAVRQGTARIVTVEIDRRLGVGAGDPLPSLATEINRLADQIRETQTGLAEAVARLARDLEIERTTLSAVLEALGEGVVLAGPDGRVELANRAAQQLLGTNLPARNLFEVVDREKLAHFVDRPRAGGNPVERFSLHSGGRVLQTALAACFEGDRRLSGLILVLSDLTGEVQSDDDRRGLLAGAVQALRNALAAIRSLSESLLGDPTFAAGPRRPLLAAVHAEAVRLSRLVTGLDRAGPDRGPAAPPRHFEQVSLPDLVATVLRRLGPAGNDLDVKTLPDATALPPLSAEVSALSGALAQLLRAVLARREPADSARLHSALRERMVQIEIGGRGSPAAADLEPILDQPTPIRQVAPLSVRAIIHQHAGEVWAFAADGHFGFRVTLPLAEIAEIERGRDGEIAGAGLASAWDPAAPGERPGFYDFSLLDEIERHPRPADRDRPLDDLTFVVFDTETTGLWPEGGDRIVSIAGVKVRGGAVRRGETFDALVQPGRPIPAASVAFHGITDQRVAAAPRIEVVLPAFLRFADGALLVADQAWFDLRFLATEAKRAGLPPLALDHPVLDTVLLSELVHEPLANHGLETTATRLGVAIRGRHSALGDALATAEVFVRLVDLLRRRNIRTLGDLAEAARARKRGPSPSGRG